MEKLAKNWALSNDPILNYAWELKKNGKAESTISTATNRLKRLSHLCNIYNPEQVRETLATLNWKNSTKHNVAQIYTGFVKYLGKQWTEPQYKREATLPFIPTEAEIDALIACGTNRTAALLQLLKETGARIGEVSFLKWVHIDQERKTIYITPEKGSNARILRISNQLLAMLGNLPKTTDRIFQTNQHGQRRTFEALRKRAAKKLNNPRLLKISLHTFRHWKGTTEYHRTKDIIHVKNVLGHKDIKSTMVYINIESAIWQTGSDEWTCKPAKTIEEVTKLIEIGFEYITEMDGIKLFRKRK